MSERIKSFEEFWPYYVLEHTNKTNRILHFVGTTTAMVTLGYAIAKRKPDLVLAAHPMLVVVMTEQSDARFESACDAAGADFWLEKRHLQARLLAFLQQRFSLRALRHSPFF